MANNIVFVSDVHLGNYKRWGGDYQNGVNRRCREILSTLKDAVVSGDRLYILGDLFDKFSVDAPIIAAAGDVLSQKETYILKGNHDANSEDPDDHALAPLSRFRNIEVHDGDAVVRKFVVNGKWVQVISIPFQPREAIEYIPEQLSLIKNKIEDEYTILCIHAGLISGNTPSYLINSSDAINCLTLGQIAHSYGINACIAGHWHDTKVYWYTPESGSFLSEDRKLVPIIYRGAGTAWENHIAMIQPGTLAPHSFKVGDTGLGLGCGVECNGPYKIGTRSFRGPRFFKMDYSELSTLCIGTTPVYLQVTCTADEFKKAKDYLQQIKNEWPNTNGVVSIEDTELKEHVREAAKAASVATNLKEAVTNYVAKLKLPKVEEKRIMSRLDEYLDL